MSEATSGLSECSHVARKHMHPRHKKAKYELPRGGGARAQSSRLIYIV